MSVQDLQKLIYVIYPESSDYLAGQSVVYTYVDDWSTDKIDQMVENLKSRNEYTTVAVVNTYAEYEAIEKELAAKAFNVMKPKSISEKMYFEKLNVLPPRRMFGFGSTTGFTLGTELAAGFYNHYIKINDAFFEIVAVKDEPTNNLFSVCEAAA